MRNASIVAIAALLFACSHRPKGPDGKPLWFEVQTEHFVLRAATDEQTARTAAKTLERVREALLASSWRAQNEPPGKVQVVLLDDHAALAAYAPRGLAGLTSQDALGQLFVAMSAEQSVSEVPVLKHELAHVIAHQFLLRSPLWLSEGLAMYLETLKLTDDSATVGLQHAAATAVASRQALDLKGLFAAGPETYLGSQADKDSFYSRSWLLVQPGHARRDAGRDRDRATFYDRGAAAVIEGRRRRRGEPAAAARGDVSSRRPRWRAGPASTAERAAARPC